MDIIRDEGDHSFLGMVGPREDDDLFAPVLVSTRRRTLWLGINLVTTLLATRVIGLFEATIHPVVALADLASRHLSPPQRGEPKRPRKQRPNRQL